MAMFFVHLAQQLDKERAGWRKNTIILLDNAPYHKSSDMLALFRELDLPIMFSGPNSYASSPCELFFAAFKSQDINPQHLPAGKR